ncbi:hypothetical protein EVAR_88970_1 [Eumeta japonica]|uniref:Uncharacterized protein n=1 Tax=Eumeta variegata TaxID=151549 RepID=A0A4C1VRU9_EUMVA|nr:hypothetical protein EVAR_88970_1 [Eumeta japonica]
MIANPVFRAHVEFIREICEVHGYACTIVKYAAHMCRCAIYKLQRNWCIRRSCTPPPLVKLVLQKTSLNVETLSIIFPTQHKNPYSEATEKKIRSAGLHGGAKLALTL